MSNRLQSRGRSHSAIVTSAPAVRSADSKGGRSSSAVRAAAAVTNAMVGLLIRRLSPTVPAGTSREASEPHILPYTEARSGEELEIMEPAQFRRTRRAILKNAALAAFASQAIGQEGTKQP